MKSDVAPNAARTLPFDAAPVVSSAARDAIERVALEANDRYLYEFLEKYAFCPFARQGREAGTSVRYVYYADTPSLEPLLELMEQIVGNTEHVVSQVIMPALEVDPVVWSRFCHELTALGHARLGGESVLAVAPLHPALSFESHNAFALVPLFRRTPDPTIQWVRLDGLEALYKGRDRGKRYLESPQILQLLTGAKPRTPLYDRVAQTNMSMARRLTIDKVVAMLGDIYAETHRKYVRILLEDDHE